MILNQYLFKYYRNAFVIIIAVLVCSAASAQQANVIISNTTINGPLTTTATNSITINPSTVISPSGGPVIFSIVPPALFGCAIPNAVLSADQNYISTFTPRIALSDGSTLASRTNCEVMQTVQYFDGLGRPLQTVQVKGNPDGSRDMVIPVAYDQFGREATKYLPYTTGTSNAGSYRPDALQANAGQGSFYTSPPAGITSISIPSATTLFEASPLNRVLEQGAPGAPWQPGNHTVKLDYGSNDAPDLTTGTGYWAKQFAVNIDATTGARTLADQGAYGANQLYVSISKDENWISGKSHTTETYTDKENRVVLKRTFNDNKTTGIFERLSTYYVYDDFGLLCFVLTPKAEPDAVSSSNPVATSTLNDLCYQYRYDDRQRLVEKKIPGKGWEYTVYNTLDQVVMTQDPNQRNNPQPQWIFTKYDALGRPVMTGICTDGGRAGSAGEDNSGRLWLESYYKTTSEPKWETPDPSTLTGYSNGSTLAGMSFTYLSINYYDDYSFPGLSAVYDHRAENSTMTRGLLTASKTNVLGTTDMLWTVNYYDDKGRVTNTYAQHYLGGSTNLNTANYDHVTNSYDFTNELTKSTRQHYSNNGGTANLALTVQDSVNYDHMGRKRQSWNTINSQTPVLLNQVDYNEVGKVYQKHLHSTTGGALFLQDIAYAYNERGWLTNQNSSKFTLNLAYNTNITTGASQQWNGNIAEMYTTSDHTAANSKIKYTYDDLNRLTAADDINNNMLTENGITYDKMGNIGALNRSCNSAASLSYSYNGNQLVAVNNNTTTPFRTYAYDVNGNATTDGGVSNAKTITYNLLNLPQSVSQGSATLATYTYESGGIKVRNTGSDGTWDYVNGIVYHNGAIDFINTGEGRAIPNGSSNYSYQYNLKDHLGNNRVSLDKTDVLQEDEYYAFGLRNGKFDASNNNRYLYNGKEIQTDLANQYDYGARFYDPVIARWTSVDPLADKYVNLSPFNYVANNPIKAVDPDGQKIIFVNGYIGFGSPPAGEKYWGGRSSSFVAGAKDYFGDRNTQFLAYNPNMGSTAAERREAGRQYAKEHLKDLTAGMSKDEQFEIVSHSMGSAYSEGIEDVLKENGYIVGQAVHINAFQAADIEDNQDNAAGTGVSTYSIDYQFTDDPVINNWFRSSPGDIKNATMKLREQSNEKDIRDRHAGPIWQGKRVWNDIRNSFKIQSEIKDFLDRALQQNPNIKVTVKE